MIVGDYRVLYTEQSRLGMGLVTKTSLLRLFLPTTSRERLLLGVHASGNFALVLLQSHHATLDIGIISQYI